MSAVRRLAIVASHPVQYYAPWFADIARRDAFDLRVFYLWDFGVTKKTDQKFGREVVWDIDLLSGYTHEFVPNRARDPGTHHFRGLDNPSLCERLEAWRPDAVLAFGYGWRSLWALPRRWKRSPIILRGDTHLLGRPSRRSPKDFIRRQFLQRQFRRYDAFACVGSANRDFYQAHDVAADQLFHVPHCIDNHRFAQATDADAREWRKRHDIPTSDVLFLFAGKFETKKRPDLLLEAFLNARLAGATLGLLGDGALRPEMGDPSGAPQRVRLLPFHNQSEMPAALRAADCVALPSQGPGETWGLIVNEAMACGTPAIVSDHVGCAADLIVSGKTGWTFPAGNAAVLALTLQSAHTAIRGDRERLRRATTTHIANYSYAAATSALCAMLAKLLPVR